MRAAVVVLAQERPPDPHRRDPARLEKLERLERALVLLVVGIAGIRRSHLRDVATPAERVEVQLLELVDLAGQRPVLDRRLRDPRRVCRWSGWDLGRRLARESLRHRTGH